MTWETVRMVSVFVRARARPRKQEVPETKSHPLAMHVGAGRPATAPGLEAQVAAQGRVVLQQVAEQAGAGSATPPAAAYPKSTTPMFFKKFAESYSTHVSAMRPSRTRKKWIPVKVTGWFVGARPMNSPVKRPWYVHRMATWSPSASTAWTSTLLSLSADS